MPVFVLNLGSFMILTGVDFAFFLRSLILRIYKVGQLECEEDGAADHAAATPRRRARRRDCLLLLTVLVST